MSWLFLLLTIAAMAFAFLASSMKMLLGCLLLALVMFVLWGWSLYRSRVAGSGRDETMMLDPVELRRLREQMQARKDADHDAP